MRGMASLLFLLALSTLLATALTLPILTPLDARVSQLRFHHHQALQFQWSSYYYLQERFQESLDQGLTDPFLLETRLHHDYQQWLTDHVSPFETPFSPWRVIILVEQPPVFVAHAYFVPLEENASPFLLPRGTQLSYYGVFHD